MEKGGFRRRTCSCLDLYFQFINLTPFTMPSFEIFYLDWNEDFGGDWAVFRG
jgi:hypothetical protein